MGLSAGYWGSAAYHVSAAGIAAGSMGAKLGDPSYTQTVFAVAFFAMSIGGAMWMLATLILTPVLRRGDAKIRAINPVVMGIVPAAALIGAFACLGLSELPKSGIHVLALLVSAAVMGLCLLLARMLRKSGFAIVGALAPPTLPPAPPSVSEPERNITTYTTTAPASGGTAMADFNRTTSRWGQITMTAGLLISVAGPLPSPSSPPSCSPRFCGARPVSRSSWPQPTSSNCAVIGPNNTSRQDRQGRRSYLRVPFVQ